MKKFAYIMLLALISALSLTACTEEEVTPRTELDNGGANNSTDGKN